MTNWKEVNGAVRVELTFEDIRICSDRTAYELERVVEQFGTLNTPRHISVGEGSEKRFAGYLGERAFGVYAEAKPKWSDVPDNGIDFEVGRFVIDVKTCGDPFYEKPDLIVDRDRLPELATNTLVLAQPTGTFSVWLLGFIFVRHYMAEATVKEFRSGSFEAFVPCDALRPMAQLKRFLDAVPNPDFCYDKNACRGLSRCPRGIACNE